VDLVNAGTGLQAFRSALGSFASGVTVLTVRRADGTAVGMTASAFSSVSAEPPLVLVCVNRANRRHDDIVTAGRFAVNVLAHAGHGVADYCARPGAEKILDEGWLADAESDGPPAVIGTIAHFDCDVRALHPEGTHSIVVGAVRNIRLAPGGEVADDPLLHFRSRYRTLVSAPAAT